MKLKILFSTIILGLVNNSISDFAFGHRGFRVLDPPEDLTRDTTRIISNLFVEQKIDNFNSSDDRTYSQVGEISNFQYR